MARPSKYNWEAIQKSYEDGFDINTLCDMYNIEKKTIQNRISSQKWEVTTIKEKEIIEKLNPIFEDIIEEFGYESVNNVISDMIKKLKYLYIIKPKGLSYYKIGIATDVEQRIKSLQTGCPTQLHCLYKKEFNSTIKLEKMIHNKFKNKKTHGEWFRLNIKDVNMLIKKLNNIGFVNGKTKI